jgi:predicted lipoprotein with Yx(FWY)xxD motif
VPLRLGGHMGRTGECAVIRPLLGVYVTGAIAPADRAVVVRHLASCEWCRDELAGLAALPGLLRRLPAPAAARAPGGGAAAPGPEPRDALLGRVLSRIGARRRRRRRAVTAAVTVLAATAAAGWALRPASPPPGLPAAGTILQTARVAGVTVLTDAAGFTLYWFGPDTATTSKCTGSCSRRWPPVTGPVTAGAGVSGAVGWIRRPDGAIQATYDGHPLYTAIVDTAPGEARGNGVTASGGRWHEVTVRGAAAPASSPSPGMGSGGGYGLSGACSAHRRPRYARTTCGR